MDRSQEEIKTKLHKINAIHYGGKVIVSGIRMLAIAIVIRLVFRERYLWRILLGLGTLILLGITLWMLIEGAQDRYWNYYFQTKRHCKMLLPNGQYECQNCGSRGVREKDQSGSVCGIRFQTLKENDILELKKGGR